MKMNQDLTNEELLKALQDRDKTVLVFSEEEVRYLKDMINERKAIKRVALHVKFSVSVIASVLVVFFMLWDHIKHFVGLAK